MRDTAPKSVRVEMSAETISRLLTAGQICAADFRCLDCRSKQCLWRLCLESCTGSGSSGGKLVSTLDDHCLTCNRHVKEVIQKQQ